MQFCTDIQTIDSNVTRHMVIPYLVNKSTDTNTGNILSPSFRKNNYSDVPQVYVISTLLVSFWHLVFCLYVVDLCAYYYAGIICTGILPGA